MAEVCCIPAAPTDMRHTIRCRTKALSSRQGTPDQERQKPADNVPRSQGAVDLRRIPLLRVTHVIDREVVVLGPKKRNCIEFFS